MNTTDILIKELIKIEGVGEKTAGYLINIGIDTPEKLANCTESDLIQKFKKLKEIGGIDYYVRTVKPWIESAKTGDYKYSIAISKYNQLCERSFQNQLNVLLYKRIRKEKLYSWIPEKADFNIEDEIINQYDDIYKDKREVENWNIEYDKWIHNSNNIKITESLRNIYRNIFKDILDLDKFKIAYGDDNSDRECAYCRIRESEIDEFINRGLITTKRLYSRGRRMEIDQRDPNKGYSNDNIALCCYWCNNAKTDEFTDEEFTKIGNVIKEIWSDRKINNSI